MTFEFTDMRYPAGGAYGLFLRPGDASGFAGNLRGNGDSGASSPMGRSKANVDADVRAKERETRYMPPDAGKNGSNGNSNPEAPANGDEKAGFGVPRLDDAMARRSMIS